MTHKFVDKIYMYIRPFVYLFSFLLLSLFLVAKSFPSLCDPLDCSLPGSCVPGISQARILECVAISSPRGSSGPRDWTRISCVGRQILHHWATREAYLFLVLCSVPKPCRFFATPRTAVYQVSVSITTSRSLLKRVLIESVIIQLISLPFYN